MSTGVSMADAAVADFNEFKKAANKTLFLIFHIQDGQIRTEHTASEDATFDGFMSLLPADDCRYAVYKMDYTTTDGRPNTKIVSIAWSPDSAKVKPKMVYAGSKDALTRALVGVSIKITATDSSELTESIMADQCRKIAG